MQTEMGHNETVVTEMIARNMRLMDAQVDQRRAGSDDLSIKLMELQIEFMRNCSCQVVLLRARSQDRGDAAYVVDEAIKYGLASLITQEIGQRAMLAGGTDATPEQLVLAARNFLSELTAVVMLNMLGGADIRTRECVLAPKAN